MGIIRFKSIEMDTQNFKIKVLDITDKVSTKGGKYLVVKTDGGSFSCWIEGLFGMLHAVKGNGETIGVTVQTKGAFKNIIGLEGIELPAKVGGRGANIGAAMERKEKSINEHVAKKNDSIIEAAIRRDSVMFVFAELNGSKPTPEALKRSLEAWTAYFTDKYTNNG